MKQDELFPINKAEKLFPSRPALATRWRWINKGVRGVKLSTIRVGGRVFVTEQMVRAFLAELNNPNRGSPTSKSEEDANKFLDRELGVK
jgi:Protein of unknown function (DUF1580)